MSGVEFLDQAIVRTARVAADRTATWRAWTSVAELRKWFGRDAKVELTPGGAYEIYFLLDGAPGQRGGEGNTVQSYLPGRLLAFTWNAPPSFGPLRDHRTYVLLELADLSDGGTAVTLTHYGWRPGEDWQKVRAYFEQAWTLVLRNLTRHLGPAATQ